MLAVAALIVATGRTQQPSPTPAAPTRPTPPKLVVLIAVDQFRADYVQTYGHQWTSGLARLVNQGAYFPLAEYPYGGTATCAGHMTIASGQYPYATGIAGNTWYDREAKKVVTCTEDPSVTSVPFGGGPGAERHSARYLNAPTFADELRAQAIRAPRIVSISLKARSAIGMVGHPGPGTMVIWEEDDGTWATSSAFAAKPWPEVDEYAKAHLVSAAYGQSWTRLMPATSYLLADDGAGEPAQATFPHPLTSATGKPDNAFVTLWERSPMSDAYIGDLAMTLAEKLQLGQRTGTDVLAIGFSALDIVGHVFGPRSHEVQDVLARLDRLIGRLLAKLDASVGPGRYVVALSSDHGVALIPQQAAALGMDSGRFSVLPAGEFRQKLDAALVAALGEGAHVANVSMPQVYLTPGAYDRLMAKPGAARAVADALGTVKGVQSVYWANELTSADATDDPVLRAYRLSYVPGRSGDLFVLPRPHWLTQAAGTSHGTPYGYDQRVPVLFYGAGIRPGRYLGAASPADIAPTLAYLTGITLARTDGRVVTEAVR